jgi:DNA-binding MarR family transcriptional regulator
MTNAQLFTLQALARADGLSIQELAARAHIGANAMSALVTRLGANGLVRRMRAEDDGRRAVVRLTARGAHAARRAPPSPAARLTTALEELSPAAARSLASGLTALLEAMGEEWHSAPPVFDDSVAESLPESMAEGRV